ncbi:hypothetical protein [Crateriforma conspicua]|uniref:Uncharacterized protein n=1 Tax=Crateriforma conspicua TaxID=2527996 RepID=A0A5C6FU96_9PLAN|nr:hypothetical protein [Crateriforma conspicua]TWU66479.1 hypothetical protein V7x_20450 [Crateriforma conspicua]
MSRMESNGRCEASSSVWIPRSKMPAAVCRVLGGPKPHEQTVRRWYGRGIKGGDGRRIRLHVRYIGGRVYTTEAWIRVFSEQLRESRQVAPNETERPAGPRPKPRQRLSSVEVAIAECEAMGV